jgi:threonine synthase
VLSFAAMTQAAMLKCRRCGAAYAIGRRIPWCDCGGLLDVDFTPADLAITGADFSFWRYGGILPVRTRVSLGEPITPVVSLPAAGRTIDAKLEYLLPTGSFKDRGAAILVGAIKDAGIDGFIEDSSGNAGAALSAYAARAGLRCEIYCPASASPAKLIQVERTGAVIHRIEGPRDNTTAAVMARVGEAFYASHNWHPLFLHGTKTMAYEIAEQYGWNPPDHIIAPTGGGAVLLGLHLGFSELIGLGRMSRMPKLHAVQTEACAPLVYDDVKPRPSVAEGILTARPPRLSMLKNVVDSVTLVSEGEIIAGFRDLGRAGFNAEPTSAVVIPAVRKLAIDPADSVLVILTGSGLKSQLE